MSAELGQPGAVAIGGQPGVGIAVEVDTPGPSSAGTGRPAASAAAPRSPRSPLPGRRSAAACSSSRSRPAERRPCERAGDEFEVSLVLGCVQRREIGVVVPGQHVVQYLSNDVRLGEAERRQELPGVRDRQRRCAGRSRTPVRPGLAGRRPACPAHRTAARCAPSVKPDDRLRPEPGPADRPDASASCHNALMLVEEPVEADLIHSSDPGREKLGGEAGHDGLAASPPPRLLPLAGTARARGVPISVIESVSEGDRAFLAAQLAELIGRQQLAKAGLAGQAQLAGAAVAAMPRWG